MLTTVKKQSININELRRALSVVVVKNAREFKSATRRKMVESVPTGRIYQRSGGRRHRASARGQRPTFETKTLANAVSTKKISEFSSDVFIADKINPENGENAKDYAERLQDGGRPIISDSDTRIAEIKFNYECQAVVDKLIK